MSDQLNTCKVCGTAIPPGAEVCSRKFCVKRDKESGLGIYNDLPTAADCDFSQIVNRYNGRPE